MDGIVAGFDYRISSAAIFTVCIVNSAMVGLVFGII